MEAQKKSSSMSTNGRQNAAAAVRTRTAEHVRRPEKRTINFLTQDELRQLFKVIRSKRDKAISHSIAFSGKALSPAQWS